MEKEVKFIFVLAMVFTCLALLTIILIIFANMLNIFTSSLLNISVSAAVASWVSLRSAKQYDEMTQKFLEDIQKI